MPHPALAAALVLAIASSAPIANSANSANDAESKARPNLVVLVTDDHPFDALGCAGHPVLQTPCMDALAADGVRFTHAFATTPICAASRASIFTGRYERSHGYTFGQPPLAAELVGSSYPTLLREAGYRVGFVGKLGVRIEEDQRERMFDDFASGVAPYFRDELPHLTERNVDRAIEFLTASKDGPFCLSLSFQAPHAEDANPDQYVWPASTDGLYVDVPLPPAATGDPAFFEALPEFLRTGFNRKRWHWRFDEPAKRDRMLRGYFRMLSGVDAGIGRIVEALDELGLRENTVIVLIGDNGYFLGERGYAGKWTMHDRSTRVPLIVNDPRRRAAHGQAVDALVANVDVAPTLLELAGIAPPEGVQGRSLSRFLDGLDGKTPEPWREEILTEHLWQHEHIPRTEGLRTKSWKFIRYHDHPSYVELYDLEHDPEEARNLAGDERHRARLEELAQRCARAVERARGPAGNPRGSERGRSRGVPVLRNRR